MDLGLGYVADKADDRDFLWRSSIAPIRAELPKSFRLRRVGPVLNQGAEGSCVGHGAAAVKQWQECAEHHKFFDFQAKELYARCKEVDGIPNESGTYPRVALKLMQERGVLAKSEPRKLKEDSFFKIQSYVRLTSINQIKESLISHGATMAGLGVDESCYSPDEKGIIAEPRPNRQIGGHCICILGFNDAKKCQGSTGAFFVKNSWGTSYGLKGFVWWPYSHFATYDFDAWQIVDSSELLTP